MNELGGFVKSMCCYSDLHVSEQKHVGYDLTPSIRRSGRVYVSLTKGKVAEKINFIDDE